MAASWKHREDRMILQFPQALKNWEVESDCLSRISKGHHLPSCCLTPHSVIKNNYCHHRPLQDSVGPSGRHYIYHTMNAPGIFLILPWSPPCRGRLLLKVPQCRELVGFPWFGTFPALPLCSAHRWVPHTTFNSFSLHSTCGHSWKYARVQVV